MSRVTIYDIAKKAGCSTATVSLALSDNERIRPETKQRIREITKQLGYTPSYIAQSLTTKSTNTLGLIVPNIDNPVFARAVSGVETYANEKGYNIILGLSHSDRKKELFYLEMLQRERVDGLIVFPTFLDTLKDKLYDLQASNSPVVLCGSSGAELNIKLSYAKCDNRTGAHLAVSHLLDTGRQRIGCIFPISDVQQYYSRKLGYQDALAKHNIPYDKSLIKVCASDDDSIYRATLELLREQRPDALFCLYDYCALCVMSAIYSEGLRIPDDISIIGYDNIPITQYLPTPLSTIDTHGQEVGAKATEILLKKIADPDTPLQQIIIQPELVMRESSNRL